MKKIGLLSDTHGSLLPSIIEFFSDCDEVWHAGDVGDPKVLESLSDMYTIRAVYGNIDGIVIRNLLKEYEIFTVEDLKVLLIHIGGYPGRYESQVKELIEEEKPGLFISGHSHILKVIYDKKLDFLHMNPGAAGYKGLHKVCTALRFKIDGKDIRDLEIWEIPRNEVVIDSGI
jgi:putative phosphoesterase